MADPDPIKLRADREETLAGLLGGAWLSWSSVSSPRLLTLDDLVDILRANEIVNQAEPVFRSGFSSLMDFTGATFTEEELALLFLIFFSGWVNDLSTRWGARIDAYREDQRSKQPRLPPWEFVRGKGGLLLPASESQQASRSGKRSDSTSAGGENGTKKRSGTEGKQPPAKYSKPLVTPADFKAESIALVVNGYTGGQLAAWEKAILQDVDEFDLVWQCEPGNCDDCGQYCGKGRAVWGKYTTGPQLHRYCRCWLKPVRKLS